jgi:hypothetical protein
VNQAVSPENMPKGHTNIKRRKEVRRPHGRNVVGTNISYSVDATLAVEHPHKAIYRNDFGKWFNTDELISLFRQNITP